MNENKDKFKTDKPLYDHSIEYGTTKLPKELQDLIQQLEEYDKVGDWFNYDLVFDMLEVECRHYLRHNVIGEKDYKIIIYKYGGLYD